MSSASSASEALSKSVLSLPMHPYLSEADIDTVCNAVIAAATAAVPA